MSAGRPSRLADDAYAQAVAEALAEGLTREGVQDRLEELGFDRPRDLATVTRYKRDPRVKSRLTKLINERVQEVTRKVDTIIAARLQNAEEMTIQELIAIRKEFLGGSLREETEKADAATVNAAFEAVESPEFQAAIAALG